MAEEGKKERSPKSGRESPRSKTERSERSQRSERRRRGERSSRSKKSRSSEGSERSKKSREGERSSRSKKSRSSEGSPKPKKRHHGERSSRSKKGRSSEGSERSKKSRSSEGSPKSKKRHRERSSRSKKSRSGEGSPKSKRSPHGKRSSRSKRSRRDEGSPKSEKRHHGERSSRSKRRHHGERSSRSKRSRRDEGSPRSKKSRRSSKSKSKESGRSPSHRKSSRSSKSRRRRSSKSRRHRCSMDCNECPTSMSRKRLMQAARRDRERREAYSVLQMINAHGMTESMMLRAMERQKAYETMRSLALHLEVVCILMVGVMGIFAQRLFNTRGDLNFYMTQMTIELFFLAIIVCNVTSQSLTARFFNIIVFIFAVGLDFWHILVIVRSRGTFWKCHENEIMLQHCMFYAIPTHYHTLYVSAFLLILHLGILLINVSAVIFYDGSLDNYMEQTPGTPQWVTDLPLHDHDRAAEVQEAKQKAEKAKLTMSDLPPGTRIIREQEERSVRITKTGKDGKQTVLPEDVTITRSYTVDAPGMGKATGRRSWKKVPGGSTESKKPSGSEAKKAVGPTGAEPKKSDRPTVVLVQKSLDPQRVKSGHSPTENVCCTFPCGGAPPSPTVTQRGAAGKDTQTETVPTNVSRVSRIPALMSRIAMLNNKNLLQKQSDYMY